MREPLKLADATIMAALQSNYGLADTALAFLPLGNDSASAVYRVQAAGDEPYFLKVRSGAGFSLPSLAVPSYLHQHGVPHILAPILTLTQQSWVSAGNFALSLYLFIDARMGVEVGLSQQQWRDLGATMQQVHTMALSPELSQIIRRETYIPGQRSLMTDLQAAINRQDWSSPAQCELAAFWRRQSDAINRLVERADTLGRRLMQSSLPLVLCHADLHTWNVLVDKEQRLWIIDWDETILAPKERDLMFVVGGIGRDLVKPHETACFLQGYGNPAIDTCALTYYRYAWAVQDIAANGERVFFTPDIGEESRRDALLGFMNMFEPGNMVAIAFASDSGA
jgi:spectinomycin phosphotransferase